MKKISLSQLQAHIEDAVIAGKLSAKGFCGVAMQPSQHEYMMPKVIMKGLELLAFECAVQSCMAALHLSVQKAVLTVNLQEFVSQRDPLQSDAVDIQQATKILMEFSHEVLLSVLGQSLAAAA